MNHKKIIASMLALFSLAGCGQGERLKALENEYAVLDYNTLRMEQSIVQQMVDEQERVVAQMDVANAVAGLAGMLIFGQGSMDNAENEQLAEDRLRLKALNNLLSYKKSQLRQSIIKSPVSTDTKGAKSFRSADTKVAKV